MHLLKMFCSSVYVDDNGTKILKSLFYKKKKKSIQAYSHLLKDGMFPERILSIERHSFLKGVLLFSKR